MSNYTINWQSDGLESIPGKSNIILPQKTLDSTSTSLTLTGKGINNYGEIQQENFLRLMENFASASPPPNSTIGQLWFNTIEQVLYLHVDPASTLVLAPKYYPQSPASWVQMWPTIQEHAAMHEYSVLASELNRIIGAPSVLGTDVKAASNQFGWGQTDLVPEYSDHSTLAPGFTTQGFPAAFDNNAWVILLSRLRKALRHAITPLPAPAPAPEASASPVGFINDSRPHAPGNTIANAYNANGQDANGLALPGTLPNYTAGWRGLGAVSLNILYTNTVAALAMLQTQRFNMSPMSSESAALVSFDHTANWPTSLVHTIDLTFANREAAESYFNSGGYMRFAWSHAPSVPDLINTSWHNFLLARTNLIFDYAGVRHGTEYVPSVISGTESLGFYDLNDTKQTIFARDRHSGAYGAYAYVSDAGLRVTAVIQTTPSSFVIHFEITFIEGLVAGETLQGVTSSSVWGHKAAYMNVNSPYITYPSGAGSGSFTL